MFGEVCRDVDDPSHGPKPRDNRRQGLCIACLFLPELRRGHGYLVRYEVAEQTVFLVFHMLKMENETVLFIVFNRGPAPFVSTRLVKTTPFKRFGIKAVLIDPDDGRNA
ncbi:hypothetical protein EVAR_87297_1 [Eumeta japonica]|uniref:Uncharacterized protein n=1 Tax=Eumeta variegata TaxID=151549 RepID=A0A4C1VUU8_EUMVA|nr:hypothetical protein EVAR_87297_1 [Eumeta japonica]